MRSTKLATLALAGLLSVTLAACGSDAEDVASNATDAASSAVGDATDALSTDPVATIDQLTGVDTAVALDQGFLDGLTSLGVEPGVLGGAALNGSTLSFPITGGDVTVYEQGAVDPYIQGEIEHEGSGLSLTAQGIEVDLEDFVVDPGESVLTGSVSANGSEVAPSANLFFLDGSTLQPVRMEGGNAVVQGTTVKLHPDAAALLRDTYGLTEDQLPDYFTVGIATITASGS